MYNNIKEQFEMENPNNVVRDQIKLSIPNKPEYVGIVRLTVAGIANRLGFDIEQIEDIKVAVAEACTNAIIHGKNDGDENYNIDFIIGNNKLEICVCDSGKGCKSSDIKKPNLEDPKEGGLGIFIIKSLMDEVEILSDLGKGMTIKMIKYMGDDN